MGLFSKLMSQFIEVIEWTDDHSTETIAYRFPVYNQEIKMGAKLTVRESQMAIFVNEGQIADVFKPGLYELSTQNMPILTTLKSWKYGFNSPFKAEVYFINTKQFSNQKWGTLNPIMMRDVEFGMLRLRAFGIYSFRVVDPVKFMKEVFATNQVFDTESITGQLKSSLVSGMTDILGESNIAALDLAKNYDEIGALALNKLQERFESFGFQLVSFFIENISLPEEVEKALDKKTSMGLLGNLQQYAQYQTAEAIGDAAQNEGNHLAGAGVGMGAGVAMGNMMGEAMKGFGKESEASMAAQVLSVVCPGCHGNVPSSQKFCSTCGQSIGLQKVKCIKCGFDLDKGIKFCSECGTAQNNETKCSGCGKILEIGVKFCADCGTKV